MFFQKKKKSTCTLLWFQIIIFQCFFNIFLGRKLDGLRLLTKETYLPDFYLIPKHEEDKYLNFQPQEIRKILPKYVKAPPVISMLMKEKNPTEEPKIEAVYEGLSEHLVYKIAEEGETPDYKLKVEIPEKFKVLLKY